MLKEIVICILVYAAFCVYLEKQIPCSVWAARPEECTSDKARAGVIK